MDLKMEIGFILEKSTKGKQMNNNKTGLRDDPGSSRRGQKKLKARVEVYKLQSILSAHKEK